MDAARCARNRRETSGSGSISAAMMRVVLSTPLVLDRLNRGTRPHNFIFCPLVDGAVGYPCDMARTDRYAHRPVLKASRSVDRPTVRQRPRWTSVHTCTIDDAGHSADLRLWNLLRTTKNRSRLRRTRTATDARVAATCARRCRSAALRWQETIGAEIWRGFGLVAVVEGSGVSTTDDGSGSRAMREGRCCWRAQADASETRRFSGYSQRFASDFDNERRATAGPAAWRRYAACDLCSGFLKSSSKQLSLCSSQASRHPRAVGSSGNQLAPGFDPKTCRMANLPGLIVSQPRRPIGDTTQGCAI